MSTLSAVLLVASSYFVCGFCLDFGSPIFNARDQAQRQPFQQFDQQFWHVDPPLADFVHLTEIRSSGANETGDITLAASFLKAADFSWMFFKNGKAAFTKGKNHESGITVTTSIDVNVNDGLNLLALHLQTRSFVVFLLIDTQNITQAGTQSVRNYFVSFDVPKTAYVDESGDVSLDVILPSNYTNIAHHLEITYIYVDVTTEAMVRGPQLYEAYSIPGTQTTRLTMRDAANKAGCYWEMYLKAVDNLDTVSDTSFSSMFVMRMVDIRNSGVSFTEDIVNFESLRSTYLVTGDDYIRHGSVVCTAYGHPKPTVVISKDGQVLESNIMGHNTLNVIAYVPLDGKTKAEATGMYNCTATSGSKTITEQITVE